MRVFHPQASYLQRHETGLVLRGKREVVGLKTKKNRMNKTYNEKLQERNSVDWGWGIVVITVLFWGLVILL